MLKYPILILGVLSLSYLTDCNTSQTLELKKYEPSGYLGPWRYIYYKALYKHVHFPMLRLQLNPDSSFSANGCVVGYAGCFHMHYDTLCLEPSHFYYYKNQASIITREAEISRYPLKLLNKKSYLLDIVISPKETLVWIIDK